jgi:osmotically-inducible protein OsmY
MKRQQGFLLPAIMLGLCITAACAVTDAGITSGVKAKLIADETVKAAQIEVSTKDGVVTLTGNVDNAAAKSKALELAKATTGVKDVVDMISAREASGSGDAPDPSRSLGETITDASISMNVKGRLLEDPLVKGLKIDVDTREGVVFLTGSVGSDQEKETAIRLAKETVGVREVKANLTVRG